MNNIAVVGLGPAGIFCALNILEEFDKLNYKSFSITLFDKNEPLKTILPTGGFRCNITNALYDIDDFILNYPRGKKFLRSIFSRYFNYDAVEYFKKIGVETYTQEDLRVFPVSNSSSFVREKMLSRLKKFSNVKFINKKITSSDELKEFDRIVISTGSRGTEDLIKSFNHKCINFTPSLCALNIEDNIYPNGVSLKTPDGDFIFTKTGISGPLAYKISSLNAFNSFPYKIELELFKYDDLVSKIQANPKKSIGNVVSYFIPKSLARIIVDNYDKKASEVSNKDLKRYSKLILNIISNTPQGEIVNAGGVDLDEVDKNIKSKIYDNLWFCGEILNIDGFCGGFNLQNCWSTGAVVAKDIVRSIINYD